MMTSVRAVNKTDVATMGAQFGTLAKLLAATSAELGRVPGLGPTKVKRLHEAFTAPFFRRQQQTPPLQASDPNAAHATPTLGDTPATDDQNNSTKRNNGDDDASDAETTAKPRSKAKSVRKRSAPALDRATTKSKRKGGDVSSATILQEPSGASTSASVLPHDAQVEGAEEGAEDSSESDDGDGADEAAAALDAMEREWCATQEARFDDDLDDDDHFV